MPKRIPEEELTALVAIVQKHRDGERIEAIRKELDFHLSDRTLQRRLNLLEKERRIVSEGRGTGKRYFPKPTGEEPAKDATAWLSEESREIHGLVTRPITARRPVPYHIEFIESYEPNRSSYLTGERCRKLFDMGRVGADDLPAGTYLRQIMDRLIIDLSWNSSRLEGNTYSLLDTERLLERGERAEGRDAEETQMILNHKAAIEMLADEAGEAAFNRYTICNLHALLGENLLPDPAGGGRLRSNLIRIGQSVYEPLQVPQQIEIYFDMMLAKAEAITDPFEQSFFVMVHLPYLQPFVDVNKRVSRLAANIPMIQNNLCPLSFVDVNEQEYTRATMAVYELNRVEYLRDVYMWAYERSCDRYSTIRQVLGEPDPFRLRYRQPIGEFIRAVVQGRMDKGGASHWISEHVERAIGASDQAKFREVVETELRGLHEGNVARYKLRLSEFKEWKANW